ncbi:hypothetical protein BH09BAC1_BH09BAC1_14290 [soil metagenome]
MNRGVSNSANTPKPTTCHPERSRRTQVSRHKTQDMETIAFNQNWNNKLDCNCFTTLRIRNDRKYRAGSEHAVELKGQPYGTATSLGLEHYGTFIDTFGAHTQAASRGQADKHLCLNQSTLAQGEAS